jgi:hypothetical protein
MERTSRGLALALATFPTSGFALGIEQAESQHALPSGDDLQRGTDPVEITSRFDTSRPIS